MDNFILNENKIEIETLINSHTNYISEKDNYSNSHIYFTVSAGYLFLHDINNRSENDLNKTIYYLRKSIFLLHEIRNHEKQHIPYINGFKLNLYTNYAIALDTTGRKIVSIEYYKKALEIDPKFGMALGNLGITYLYYGNFLYDINHQYILQNISYHYLKNAYSYIDENIYANEKIVFKEYIDSYGAFDSNESLSFPKFKYNGAESKYRNWVLSQSLFLNPLNDLPFNESAFSHDIIHLPTITFKINEKPIYYGMFNQIKQEFIYSRYQYYKALDVIEDTHFADKNVLIYDTFDYTQHSIRIEMLKTSFKTLYSLLDKVAYLLNQYFDLGIKEYDISFKSIWRASKNGKNGYTYKNKLDYMTNYALLSLYWINKDFTDEKINPNLKHFSNIRNALEHKYVKVCSDYSPRLNGEVDELAMYITESELKNETLHLLKLLREVLIYTSSAIHIEEQKRNLLITKKELIGKIKAPLLNDMFKI